MVSTIRVAIAPTMAPNPAKGNFCQTLSSPPRQSEVRSSNASGRMWMKPVARMTPAAKALIAKNTSRSGRSAGTVRLRCGRQQPMAPQTRMETKAAIFSGSARDLSREVKKVR
ncbi:hypothetical protein ACMD2_00257 [Ananas comosus]|uniref:Uncharacterized protein n=1 Tax=Ananas comosus TaxID=4615 RepID=A0A199W241_ANACO|nr:hypothetical protein ACMD2_00257 [Ananas comosus]